MPLPSGSAMAWGARECRYGAILREGRRAGVRGYSIADEVPG